MLVAIDSNGCVDTTLQVYQMNEIIVMNVPNAFTIDDNNLNDAFKPIFSAPEAIVTYDFSIFNRWGQLIYQTKDPMDAWDGKYLGKFVQTGAYNWTVNYTDINKVSRFANGHVVVLK
jgi:gliding motility-associated-like protein